MDDEGARLTHWLKQLPDQAVIEWVDDHMSAEQPWCGSWVDVRVPTAEEELHLNWLWTILGPDCPQEDRPEDDVLSVLIVEYDLDLHAVYDPKPPNYWYVKEFAIDKGNALTTEQDLALQTALIDGPDRTRSLRGGWSPNGISTALAAWAAEHAKRDDITFVWNPALGLSKFVQAAEAALERMEAEKAAGKEPGYDAGDKIRLSEEAMEALLRMPPDEAATVIEQFKNLLEDEGVIE